MQITLSAKLTQQVQQEVASLLCVRGWDEKSSECGATYCDEWLRASKVGRARALTVAVPFPEQCWTKLGQNVVDHLATYVRQPEVAAAVAVG